MLLVKVDAVYVNEDGEEVDADFDVEIDYDDNILFKDPDFDIEAELSLEELGFGTTPQVAFYKEFKENGIVGLISNQFFREDTLYALSGGEYKEFAGERYEFGDNEMRNSVGEAIRNAVYSENSEAIEPLAQFLKDTFDNEMTYNLYTTEMDSENSSFIKSSCIKFELYIGDIEISSWTKCWEIETNDPVYFTLSDKKESILPDGSYSYIVEHLMRVLEIEEQVPDIEEIDQPVPDDNGKYGVAYLEITGSYCGLDERGQGIYKPKFTFVQYENLSDAEWASDISLDIIKHLGEAYDWNVFILKYDGVFSGRKNIISEHFPNIAHKYPDVKKEANVLIPWKLLSVVLMNDEEEEEEE